MRQHQSILPPNGMIIVASDLTMAEIPAQMGPKRLAWTDSCIVVGTQFPMDGPTALDVIFDDPSFSCDLQLAFSGMLKITGDEVGIWFVDGTRVCRMPLRTSDKNVLVVVWRDHSSEPATLAICLLPRSGKTMA